MARININGVNITTSGRNVSIVNGRVVVDGKPVDVDTTDAKEVHVTIEGDVGNLEVDVGTITVNGNVTKGNAKTTQGAVNVTGNVSGSAFSSQGNVTCGDVGGDARTKMGNVTCGNVEGEAHSDMGNVTHR